MKNARIAIRPLAALLTAALLFALVPGVAMAKQGKGADRGKGHEAKVMTRNLYLGADLAPAISASGLAAFTEATGQILREVTANCFP